MNLKVGDKVVVISGKSKGTEGKINKTLKKENKVIVEGANMVTKHVKPNANNENGGIIKVEAPIHVSNVALVDPKTKKATKVKYDVKDGKKVRVAKKSSTVLA